MMTISVSHIQVICLTYNNITKRKKKANRWSPRVQLYLPLGKDRKWGRERLKGFKKTKKGKTEIKEGEAEGSRNGRRH
jgi:hypothetical protein